jgi:hypothetical protein
MFDYVFQSGADLTYARQGQRDGAACDDWTTFGQLALLARVTKVIPTPCASFLLSNLPYIFLFLGMTGHHGYGS